MAEIHTTSLQIKGCAGPEGRSKQVAFLGTGEGMVLNITQLDTNGQLRVTTRTTCTLITKEGKCRLSDNDKNCKYLGTTVESRT